MNNLMIFEKYNFLSKLVFPDNSKTKQKKSVNVVANWEPDKINVK